MQAPATLCNGPQEPTLGNTGPSLNKKDTQMAKNGQLTKKTGQKGEKSQSIISAKILDLRHQWGKDKIFPT